MKIREYFFMRKKLYITILALIIICYAYLTAIDKIELLNGKKTTYLQSSSSLAEIVYGEEIAFNKTGVSVELNENILIEELLDFFNAKLIFTESTMEGISYYAYSKDLKRSTILNGKRINLHVHYSGKNVVVGTPIIFGSF